MHQSDFPLSLAVLYAGDECIYGRAFRLGFTTLLQRGRTAATFDFNDTFLLLCD